MKCFRTHVIVVSMVKNQHQLAIYEIENKFIAFLRTYTKVDHILCEEDGIYIFSRNNKGELVI